MNNKGFMMAEVIVVASLILVSMVGLYSTYNKIIGAYNQRISYYDVATLYDLAIYRDNSLSGVVPSLNAISNDGKKRIYYVDGDDILNVSRGSSDRTLEDYLKFLSGAVTFDTDYILIMENCKTQDNCKYAYLEVYDDEA